jgi:hypothetical protein
MYSTYFIGLLPKFFVKKTIFEKDGGRLIPLTQWKWHGVLDISPFSRPRQGISLY